MIHMLNSFTLILLSCLSILILLALFIPVRNVFSVGLVLFFCYLSMAFFLIFSLYLFPLTVHVFISCLAISSLIAYIPTLNFCFYKMMACLNLFRFTFSIFILSVATFFFCRVHLLFALYCFVLFFF